jgi:hypothetical protein
LQIPTTASVVVTQTALSTTVVTPVVSNNVTITPPVVTIQSTYTAAITIPETIITGTTTTTTTFTSVATSIVSVCEAYVFVALNGPYSGQYFTSRGTESSLLYFTTETSQARPFSYDSISRTYMTIGTNLIFVAVFEGSSGIAVVSNDLLVQEDFVTIVCTMTPASDLSYGAIFTATCRPNRPSTTGSYSFYVDRGTLGIQPTDQGQGEFFDLGVVC